MQISQLSNLDTKDFVNLIQIFNQVFENSNEIPPEDYLAKLLSKADFLVFVAKKNDEVVGGLTVYILHQYYSEKPLAYIYDVGVSPSFQRQGIGKNLIAAVNSYCQKNNFEAAYVEAELEDAEAIQFYKNTNFSTETGAVHFTYLH